MKKLTPSAIMVRVAPAAVRWPERDTSFTWQYLHESVDTLRGTAEIVDGMADEIESNQDLSEAGRRRRIAEIGLKAINDLRAAKPVASARSSVKGTVETLSARVAAAIKPPSSPADIALAAEIRAHMRSLGKEAHGFFNKYGADERVASAVLNAPAFLSGLNDTEHAHYRMQAETRIDPKAREAMEILSKAGSELEDAVSSAERLIGERTGLVKNRKGEWEPPAMPAVPSVTKAA